MVFDVEGLLLTLAVTRQSRGSSWLLLFSKHLMYQASVPFCIATGPHRCLVLIWHCAIVYVAHSLCMQHLHKNLCSGIVQLDRHLARMNDIVV